MCIILVAEKNTVNILKDIDYFNTSIRNMLLLNGMKRDRHIA